MPTQPNARNPRRRSVIVGLCSIVIRDAGAAGRQRVMRAFLESWPPYVYPDDAGTAQGLDAELLQAICQEAGFQLLWVRTPQARRRRRYQELLSGRYDVVFSATPDSRDLDLIAYTRPYRQEIMMVAAPAIHDPILDSLHSFEDVLDKRIRVLCVDVGGLGKDFEAHRGKLDSAGLLVPYPTTPQGIEMLRVGRGQIIVGDARDLQTQSRLLAFPLLQQPYGLSVEPVSLLLSRRRLNAADLQAIDRAIDTLERRGVLAAIRERYAP